MPQCIMLQYTYNLLCMCGCFVILFYFYCVYVCYVVFCLYLLPCKYLKNYVLY